MEIILLLAVVALVLGAATQFDRGPRRNDEFGVAAIMARIEAELDRARLPEMRR
ncbi:hypothetical protein ACWIGI_06915 [Nocardia sp. NPDC055321]